jgi:hypothetical protein
MIRILDREQSYNRYSSYTKVAHHDHSILFIWNNDNLFTHECNGEYVEHNVFPEQYDMNTDFYGCGRYCPKEKVITVYDETPTNSRVRKLIKRFPEAELIAVF